MSVQTRNVLYISYYFPPMGLSGVQRTLKFAKYLPDYNWEPIILTQDANSYYAYDDTLINELGEDAKVYRTEPKDKIRKTNNFPNYLIQKTGRYLSSYLYIPDSKIKWKNKALALGREIIVKNDIQVILATAPPFTDFLVAYELSLQYDIPFVIDYRDIWVENQFHYFPTPYHKRKNEELEHKILAHASRIIVTTRFSKEVLLKKYKFLNHSDISIVPHGYDKKDFEIEIENTKNKKLIITHSGLFQDDRTPKYLLKALSNLLKEHPEYKNYIELRFVGLMRQSHIKLIKKNKLEDNCKLYGYVTHSETVRLLKESDILWLMMKDNVRSPGKLYEYIGARKPIFINAPVGSMTQLVQESKAGFITEATDIKGIMYQLNEIVKLWNNGNLPQPKDDFVEQYDRQKLTGLLAKELSLSSKI